MTTIDLHMHTRKCILAQREGARQCGPCEVASSPVGWPPSKVRTNDRVGLAQMAAVERLSTVGNGAVQLEASFFHAAGKSAPWLFGDSLPTNRQLASRDLFAVSCSIERDHTRPRITYILDSRPLAAFSRFESHHSTAVPRKPMVRATLSHGGSDGLPPPPPPCQPSLPPAFLPFCHSRLRVSASPVPAAYISTRETMRTTYRDL